MMVVFVCVCVCAWCLYVRVRVSVCVRERAANHPWLHKNVAGGVPLVGYIL